MKAEILLQQRRSQQQQDHNGESGEDHLAIAVERLCKNVAFNGGAKFFQDAASAFLARPIQQTDRYLPVVLRLLSRCCRDSVAKRVVRECCQCSPQRETSCH
jgi:hypothetical protein